MIQKKWLKGLDIKYVDHMLSDMFKFVAQIVKYFQMRIYVTFIAENGPILIALF